MFTGIIVYELQVFNMLSLLVTYIRLSPSMLRARSVTVYKIQRLKEKISLKKEKRKRKQERAQMKGIYSGLCNR
jgi:uncharacterized protein YqiB (DUF1249 family)